jgi:O-antigen/teichoic acid export membrane protein
VELLPDAGEALSGGSVTEPTRQQVVVGSAGTALAIIAAQAAVGLSFLVLARQLTTGEFGTYAILYAVGVTLGGVLDFGSSQLRTRELAKGFGRDSFWSWLWRRAAWQTPVVLIAIVFSQLAVGNKASLLVTTALISQGLTCSFSLGASGAVRALRSPVLGTWVVAVGNAVLLVAVLVAPGRALVEVAAVAATASWLVTTVCSWWLVKSRLGPTRSHWNANPWAGSLGFGLFGLAVSLQGLQIAIVGAVAGSIVAGELAAVARWAQPVHLIAAAGSIQIFPSMAAATSDGAARRILRPIWDVCGLGVVVAAGMIVTAPWLVDMLLGDGYENSVILLQAMAIVAVLAIFTQPLAAFLQARGAERQVAIITTVALGASLAATGVLASLFGALAAPLSFGIGNCALLAALIWISKSKNSWTRSTP